LTFVNKSGQSVSEAVRFYKLNPEEDLLVIVDDTALPCGRIRVRQSGGAGGHNGLRDIATHLSADNWARIRIGIDAPGDIPLSSYVLGKFRPDQQDAVEQGIEQAVEAATCWMTRGTVAAMNAFNADREPTSSPEEIN
jgi:PTH1 family peptidyl-tRNA hydrolase